MTTRRLALKFLGFSSISAPLAAKAATDKAAAELSGISQTPTGFPPLSYASPGLPQSNDDWKKKVLRFLAGNVLPDWIDDEIRERNRHVPFLDPDIACKRSWSLNVKIAEQRQRNIEMARKHVLDGPRRSLRLQDFQEKYGVWL